MASGLEKAERFGKFLKDQYELYRAKRREQGHPAPSQGEYAVQVCHVGAQNFSQWSIAQRLPRDIVDIDNLAAAMGSEIYEILGISPRMPKSKELNTIATNWHRLNDDQRRQMEEYFLNFLKEI